MIGTGDERRKVKWNQEEVQKLRDLWDTGMPAPNIADHFNGATRNSIIGKAHRLGLPTRTRTASQNPQGIAKKPVIKRKTPMVLKPRIPKPKPPTPPEGNLIPFLEMNAHTCRSVEGKSLQGKHTLALYCSNPKKPWETFCLYHQGIYYRPEAHR